MVENEADSSQPRPSPEAAQGSLRSEPAEIAQRSGEPAETPPQTAPESPSPEPPKAPSEAGSSPRAAQPPVGEVARAERPLEASANESIPAPSASASSSGPGASCREVASQTEDPQAADTGEAATAAASSSSPAASSTQTQSRQVEQESLSAASAPADAAAPVPAEPDLEQQPARESSTEQRRPRRPEAHSGPESGEDTAQPLLGEETQRQGRIDVTLLLKGAAVLASILVVVLTFRPILAYVTELLRNPCEQASLCPKSWETDGIGGFYCPQNKGCRPAGQGPFPHCERQCSIGAATLQTAQAQAPAGAPPPAKTFKAGKYDLRFVRKGKLLGCLAPVNKVPGASKYGCSGAFDTAKTCDAAKHRVKDTDYVAAVHKGCKTQEGKGTYGYAYDDGVGLKQCSPITRYEWILCSHSKEPPLTWSAENGIAQSSKRFRVTNKCKHRLWVQSSGAELPHDPDIVSLSAGESYDYSIPLAGLPSTRFLPKIGCDDSGNNCLVQSMPPCPTGGCTPPIDSKFEASFGCILDHRASCSKTGQGQVSTYQDWWDGSAVDGWTLPFSILVNDGGHGLAPGTTSSHGQCGDVVCSELLAEKLCPRQEFLTPES